MKINDIIVEARREGVMVVHGTSSALLRSILKNGIKGDPAVRVWDQSSPQTNTGSLETVGGSYWSKEMNIARDGSRDAVKKFGGNMLYIFANISEGAAFADEDNISGEVAEIFEKVIQSESRLAKVVILKSWVDLFKRRSTISNLSGMFSRSLHLRLRTSVKQPLSQELMVELFETYAAYLIMRRQDQLSNLDDILLDFSNVNARLRELYNRLTRYYTKSVYDDVTFRVNGDIGYGGRNRIIAIIEDRGDGDDFVVHYGNEQLVKQKIFGRLLPLMPLERGGVIFKN